jgi:hypothetical protein
MPAMAQNPYSDMMSAWKKVNDDFIATWGKSFQQMTGSAEGEAAAQEVQKTYLGMRTAMADAAKNAYGPVIEAVGAVPLSEFQRLADQVHTILLRMDRIDDALRELAAAVTPAPAPVKAAPAKKAAPKKAATRRSKPAKE